MTPVFITLDPARDSIEQVAAYVRDFHPRMIGAARVPLWCTVACRRCLCTRSVTRALLRITRRFDGDAGASGAGCEALPRVLHRG